MGTKGFKKSKAYGLVGFIALFTALTMAQGVKADEVSDNAGNAPQITLTEPQGADENNASESGTTSATQFDKVGDEIKVTNPDVKMEFPNGYGKYSRNQVTYNVDFPDSLEINEGDKVIFDLPKEVGLQTNYSFDVYNPEKQVVGKATADAQASNITTVFNDYFKSHPLNKSMSLHLDTKWTEAVTPGKPVEVNFNGTIQKVTIGEQQAIGADELISKWGSQDKDDPTKMNWAMRLNYSRRLLNNVKILDTMSDNQKLIDDSFVINYVDSVDPWIDKGSAMELVESISKGESSFEITMPRLDRMIYIWYSTKLKDAVSESTNPTNKVVLTAEDASATSNSHIQLVGGKGDAKGDNKPEPTWAIPNDAPKAEKPEFPLDQVPTYHEVPGDAPTADKPEFPLDQVPQYHEVPNDAPKEDKPEFPIDLVPKPEVPVTPVKPEPNKPVTPKPEEPKTPTTPVERPSNPVEKPKAQPSVVVPEAPKRDSEAQYEAHRTLPNTGDNFGTYATLTGIVVVLALILAFWATDRNRRG